MRLIRRTQEGEGANGTRTAEAPGRASEGPLAAGPEGARAGERPAPAGERAGGEGGVAARRERRGIGWRTRDAGAAAAGAVGAGFIMLARLVMTVATLIALLIALAIVLRDVDANAGNSIVKGIHEGANFFAGAFTGLISFSGHAKRAITVDWGIALLVYLLVGSVLAGFIRRLGRGGLRIERSRRAALR
ncbi:MAG TPA: hypothetical protein VGN13_08310 [Solirubrobacteraceae bacterium]|jgi:hypothetical protein